MMTDDKSTAVDSLQFVRLKIPRLIPVALIEAVKGRTFTPDQFYAYQEQQIDNPYNHLYVLIDTNKRIHGYLWADVNMLDGSLFLNTFSIDKEYWHNGQIIPEVVTFLKNLRDRIKAPRVYWITTNVKFFLKHGLKKSKQHLMEFDQQDLPPALQKTASQPLS